MTVIETPTVHVVDDEPDIVDLFASWLEDDYRVQVSYGGREALETFGDDVDVVLLDRRMPDLDGTTVLNRIRERDDHCRIALVTAVEPTTDVVELGFDDYVVKPVTRGELSETVESLAARSEYSESLQEYFALVSKRASLTRAGGPELLESSATFEGLERRIETLESEFDELFGQLDASDFEVALRSFPRDEFDAAAVP